MKVTILKYLSTKGKILEVRKDNFRGRDLPKNIIEEYEIEIEGEEVDLSNTWCDATEENYKALIKRYPECNKYYNLNQALSFDAFIVKNNMFSLNGKSMSDFRLGCKKVHLVNGKFEYVIEKPLEWYDDKKNFPMFLTDINGEIYCEKFPLNEGTKGLVKAKLLRPATQEEVLALVYQPKSLAEESKTAPKQEPVKESDRLKELVLNNQAEVLVENEEEFRLIYDFLDKNCDKDLNRYLESDGSFDYRDYGKKYPIVVFAKHYYRNIYEWNYLKNRNESKVLVKYNGKIFSEERL